MIYVYAVSEPLTDAPAGCGLDDAPLRVVGTRSLAAVVSDRDSTPLHVQEDALWAHERVVEQLMLDRTVLPMRFGSTLPDDEAARALLTSRAEELRSALRRVSGAVELGVRVVWHAEATNGDETATTGRGPGAQYLLTRACTYRRADALAERLDRPLAKLSRERVQRVLPSPGLAISAAYLVDQAEVEAFSDQIATLEMDIDDASVTCTGPWPPYTFTGAQA
ncbi:MAG: GvpL/GvpF family gas vesicle protein [Actinobacteria bacterium]|nr:GvpL/GvpF family gas vesicle protein [Actinomycetota bacterium]